MGPHDYNGFIIVLSHLLRGFSLAGQEGKSHSLLCMLDMHVQAIDPSKMRNSIQTWSKVHKQNLPALGNCPMNNTSINDNAPILISPTSPIIECHLR